MASSTSFLSLILPGNGEFTNTWDEAVNPNFDKIDAFASDVSSELSAARGSLSSLGEFLLVAHNSDGTLKPTAEVEASRNSPVYGDRDDNTTADFTLKNRLDLADLEIWKAREGDLSLRDALAGRSFRDQNMIINGSKDAQGYPTWASPSADKVNIDGQSNLLELLIGGYRVNIRSQLSVTIAGGSGTYYVYAQFEPDGILKVNGDPAEAGPPNPPLSADGVTSTATGESYSRIFSDSTKDFTALDVKAGDILTLSGGADAGSYIIKEVAPDSDPTKLRINGRFPKGGLSGQAYTIVDPLAVSLGFDSSESPAEGKLYLLEADFDGSAVTAVRARFFKNEFISEWRAVDVSGSPNFEEIFNHGLGSDNLEVSFQASQSNDGSTPTENLSLTTMSHNLTYSGAIGSLALNDSGVNYTPPTLTAGDQTIDNPGTVDHNISLIGVPGGTVGGDVTPNSSVRAKYTKNKLWVKNAVSGKFYRDYDDNDRQTGYIRVILRKRG